MDPEACWQELQSLAQEIVEVADEVTDQEGDHACEPEFDPDDVLRMAELVLALRDWVRKGGFVPRDFERKTVNT